MISLTSVHVLHSASPSTPKFFVNAIIRPDHLFVPSSQFSFLIVMFGGCFACTVLLFHCLSLSISRSRIHKYVVCGISCYNFLCFDNINTAMKINAIGALRDADSVWKFHITHIIRSHDESIWCILQPSRTHTQHMGFFPIFSLPSSMRTTWAHNG